MTIWTPDLSRHSGPRYLAIADSIAEAIAAGDLPTGVKLPPQRDLAWRLGVTVGTVSRAYMLAESRGLLSGEVGRGTYVRGGGGARSGAPVAGRSVVESINLAVNAPSSIAGSLESALRGALADLAQREGLFNLMRYMPDLGHADHRAAGARWIGRVGLDVSADQIVLTAGAQQGMVAVLSGLAGPGATVLTESLCYGGTLEVLRLFGMKAEGVAIDDEGLWPDALDAAARRTGARMVVIQPTVHNPTAAGMSLARRRAIAEVARACDLTIVEDDVYGFLPVDRPPTIASLAPERTVYLASMSKCVAPGLRVGWIACPPALIERFANVQHALALSQPALNAELASQWVLDGTAARLTDELRRETELRQQLAQEIFSTVPGLRFQAQTYATHIFIHLPEPWRREEFVAAADRAGIRILPATSFAVSREQVPHAVRLALGAPIDRGTLSRSCQTLRDILLQGPGERRIDV